MDLDSLDFRTLKTLQLVYRLGSFSEAALALGVKQPTVSYAIERVRKAVNDPLFVRQGGGSQPTQRCHEIMILVHRILDDAASLRSDEVFDPAQAKGPVTISCSFSAMYMIMGQVFSRLRREAPGLEPNVLTGYRNVVEDLDSGLADIVIASGVEVGSGLYSRRILEDHAVCIMDPSNPLAEGDLTLADLETANHVQLKPWSGFEQAYITKAKSLGLNINTVAVTDNIALDFMIEGTDLISGTPSRAARKMFGQLAIKKFPFHAPLTVELFWSAVVNSSKLNQWLRQIVVEEAAKVPPPMEF